MPKVKLTITESRCRCGYFKKGQEFIVEDLCPPLCHELWNNIYPLVYALQNGAELDYGNTRAKMFHAVCPDEGIVKIQGEINIMREIIAYEMSFKGSLAYSGDLSCIPFEEKYWNEYMKIYNECFYEMRKALEIKPLNFYSDYSQMKDKADSTFLYLQNEAICGAVSFYGNELDDLIVGKPFQNQGLGQKLLLWGMNHIKEQGYDEIILHAAEWNQNAVRLYLKNGFTVQKKEKVR